MGRVPSEILRVLLSVIPFAQVSDVCTAFWYTDFYSLDGAVEFREFPREVERRYCHSEQDDF